MKFYNLKNNIAMLYMYIHAFGCVRTFPVYTHTFIAMSCSPSEYRHTCSYNQLVHRENDDTSFYSRDWLLFCLFVIKYCCQMSVLRHTPSKNI